MTLPTDEELRALVAMATPGPWSVSDRQSHERPHMREIDGDHWFALAEVVTVFDSPDTNRKLKMEAQGAANAALIVAAVNSLPDLLKRLSQAEGERDDWKERALDRGVVGANWRDRAIAAEALAQSHKDRADRLAGENQRLRDALETFAIMANDETAYLPDEHVISLTYDDSALDEDLGGPNTLLGERFMRAFRSAKAALQDDGGAK